MVRVLKKKAVDVKASRSVKLASELRSHAISIVVCNQEYAFEVGNNSKAFFFLFCLSHDKKEVSVHIEEVIGLGVNDFIEGGVRFQKQGMFPKLRPKHRGVAVLALCHQAMASAAHSARQRVTLYFVRGQGKPRAGSTQSTTRRSSQIISYLLGISH